MEEWGSEAEVEEGGPRKGGLARIGSRVDKTSRLPEGWVKTWDSDERCFYYAHRQTGERTKARPEPGTKPKKRKSQIELMVVNRSGDSGDSGDSSDAGAGDGAEVDSAISPLQQYCAAGVGTEMAGGQEMEPAPAPAQPPAQAPAPAKQTMLADERREKEEEFLKGLKKSRETKLMYAEETGGEGFARQSEMEAEVLEKPGWTSSNQKRNKRGSMNKSSGWRASNVAEVSGAGGCGSVDKSSGWRASNVEEASGAGGSKRRQQGSVFGRFGSKGGDSKKKVEESAARVTDSNEV